MIHPKRIPSLCSLDKNHQFRSFSSDELVLYMDCFSGFWMDYLRGFLRKNHLVIIHHPVKNPLRESSDFHQQWINHNWIPSSNWELAHLHGWATAGPRLAWSSKTELKSPVGTVEMLNVCLKMGCFSRCIAKMLLFTFLDAHGVWMILISSPRFSTVPVNLQRKP